MVKRISQDEDFLNLLPTKWWVKFFKKFNQIDQLPVSKWKPVHHLSYLTNRYQDTYGNRFSFSLTGSPSKCTEIHMIKKMIAVLGTSNQKTVKEYVDWVYDKKIIPNGLKFRSIGFFANSQFCNEFHLSKKEEKKVKRDTLLPKEFREIINSFNLPMETFGDLAFAKQALDQNPEAESRKPYKVMFHELYKVGFEYRMLENIK